jgi:1,4-dihydroxy-6-naphthoate synthase
MNKMKQDLSLAYSPCPNDTFMFCALATGQIPSPQFDVSIQLHDVQTLNEHVLAGAVDISKVSFHAYLRARSEYTLLNAGAALGFGCGPLVIAQRADALDTPATARIAVPGDLTTANLLLHLWKEDIGERIFMPYDQVMSAVLNGEVDAGVIIHESRFVYEAAGLVALMDLGAWWEQETGLPIPLGGIVARRSLGEDTHQSMETLIRQSIMFAQHDPQATRDYVTQHSQEMDAAVLDRHIATFVNAFSLSLGEQGQSAIDRLSEMATGRVPGL